jgi:hypothetical protein
MLAQLPAFLHHFIGGGTLAQRHDLVDDRLYFTIRMAMLFTPPAPHE